MKTILFIDDSPSVLYALALFFQDVYAVVIAESSAVALTMVANGLRPDVIVADLHMIGDDGDEFVKKLRATGSLTPVILNTGYLADVKPETRALFAAVCDKLAPASGLKAEIDRIIGGG